MSMFVVATLFRHTGLTFFVFFLVSEAPLHYIVVVAKLNNSCVPSSEGTSPDAGVISFSLLKITCDVRLIFIEYFNLF